MKMRKANLFKLIGPLIYMLICLINKFIIEVPDVIYIATIIISIGFLLSGLLLSQQNKTF